ncbi:MAG: fumarylacetoacetate hydrolase family protein [Anaerolineae bacterium]
MSKARYLCRFHHGMDRDRFGVIVDERLYDLTDVDQPWIATLCDWLKSAAGRVPEALEDLSHAVSLVEPVGTMPELLAQGLQLLAPIDEQEVWAAGVTYEMSREARMRESQEPTIYGSVYTSDRPELFFKATPHRVSGPGSAVCIRADSAWNVPEAELTLLLTPRCEIAGFTVGNDMSSRDIEGANPLYLPQAKCYDRACSLGPWIRLADPDFDPLAIRVTCQVFRDNQVVFEGSTSTASLHRSFEELLGFLDRCNCFPCGSFLMTGTGIVPPDTFTLEEGDVVALAIDGIGELRNPVAVLPVASSAAQSQRHQDSSISLS